MLFYGFTVLGVILLGMDIAGRLTADHGQLSLRKTVGIAAAVITGLTPLLLWRLGQIEVGPGFTVIAIAYLTALTTYLVGLLVRPDSPISRLVSRIGYVFLLTLASLPSFVLLVLAAPAALAGIGLTRPKG